MAKEAKKGTQFYAETGLKPITVHVPKDLHQRLMKTAEKEERSLHVTVRRILEEYFMDKSK